MGSQSNLYLAILPLFVIYLWLEHRWHTVSLRQHIARLSVALVGYGFDSLVESFGLISFSGEQPSGFSLAPLWLALMWLWFMTTFANCYVWLINHTYIAILFATVFGPVAYWGAAQISSIIILEPIAFTVLSMTFWMALFATIFTKESWRKVFIHHPND